MKRCFAIFAAASLLAAGGCSFLSTGFGFRDLAIFQDAAIENRNQNEAYKAWKRAKWDYWRQGVPHYLREHIGRGFQQGFIDAVSGGGQELPYFPPRHYWGPAYQNARGNEMIAAWFRGYTDGAMAGEQSGLARYITLPTSSAVPMTPGAPPPTPPVNAPATPPAPAPSEYLPPDLLQDVDAVPAVPAVPVIPPTLPPATKEPLPLPPSGKQTSIPHVISPTTTAATIGESDDAESFAPPPMPGKPASTPSIDTKPAVLPAVPTEKSAAAKSGEKTDAP